VTHTNKWDVHPNTALYSDGFVYCVSGYGKGGVKLRLSEDGSSVEEVWTNSTLDNQMGGVILHEGRLYGAGHDNRQFICLDWETGEELHSTRDFQRGNTIFADGLLYFYDERGKVGLIQPQEKGFTMISEFEVTYGERQHWAHLVIEDKKLYVRHGNALMVYSIAR
jgi:outer membrane protein assembly factor BamB